MSHLIRRLEVRSRTERHGPNGSEVVIDYHIDPYKCRPLLVSSLLGYVTLGADSTKDTRVLPARDLVYPNYFCQEVECDQIDQEAIAGGISTGFFPAKNDDFSGLSEVLNAGGKAFGNIVNADGILQAEYDPANQIPAAGLSVMDAHPFDDIPTAKLHAKRALISGNLVEGTVSFISQPPAPPESAGSFVRAVYRPVFSAYKSVNPDTGGGVTRIDAESFDYCNPHFEPHSRLIRTDRAARALVNTTFGLGIGNAHSGFEAGLNAWQVENWEEFTIQRLMCPRVPWQTITQMENTINQTAYAPSFATFSTLPNNSFPPETLRFNGASVIEHYVPLAWADDAPILDSLGVNPIAKIVRWYDIEYRFSWRTTWAQKYDVGGNLSALQWIGWNTVFAGPFSAWKNLGLSWYPPAWYDVQFLSRADAWQNLVGGFRSPYSYAENILPSGFDHLFFFDSK